MHSRLYLVRHGQTIFNTRHLIQGRCDSPLTDLGRDQARCVGTWLHDNDIRISAAFASLAERACSTLELMWAGRYMRLEGLCERDFSTLEGGPLSQLPNPIGDYPVPYGAESMAHLETRLNDTMMGIMQGAYDGFVWDTHAGRSEVAPESQALVPSGNDTDGILVVSHGAACKAFAHQWLEGAQAEIPYPFPNCEVLVYDFDGERFTLIEAANPAESLGGEGLPV